MQFSVLRHELTDWVDLSSSKCEGLLCLQRDNVFIISKIRTMRSTVSVDEAAAAYFKRLREEVVVERVAEHVWCAADVNWRVFVSSIESKASRYTAFACAVLDGILCIVDVVLPEAIDYQAFEAEFDILINAIDFGCLDHEIASLGVGDVMITVTGISDVCLQSADEAILLFVGKNKYFTVTCIQGSIQGTYQRLLNTIDLSVLTKTEEYTRFAIVRDGQQCGTIELRLMEISGHTVEILGYQLGKSDATIDNNLSITIGERDTI